MTDQEILDNAPEGATHVDGDYFYICNEGARKSSQIWNVLTAYGWDETGGLALCDLIDMRSIADIRRIAELEKALRDIVNDSVEVTANARNTPSVRKKFELGGYIKHYVVPRHTIVNAMNLKEQVPREPTQELYDEAFND